MDPSCPITLDPSEDHNLLTALNARLDQLESELHLDLDPVIDRTDPEEVWEQLRFYCTGHQDTVRRLTKQYQGWVAEHRFDPRITQHMVKLAVGLPLGERSPEEVFLKWRLSFLDLSGDQQITAREMVIGNGYAFETQDKIRKLIASGKYWDMRTHMPEATWKQIQSYYRFRANYPDEAQHPFSEWVGAYDSMRLSKTGRLCVKACTTGKPSPLRAPRQYCQTEPYRHRGITYRWDDC